MVASDRCFSQQHKAKIFSVWILNSFICLRSKEGLDFSKAFSSRSAVRSVSPCHFYLLSFLEETKPSSSLSYLLSYLSHGHPHIHTDNCQFYRIYKSPSVETVVISTLLSLPSSLPSSLSSSLYFIFFVLLLNLYPSRIFLLVNFFTYIIKTNTWCLTTTL